MRIIRLACIVLGATTALLVASEVAAAPSDVVLILDNSVSMRTVDPDRALGPALRAFAGQLPPDWRLALLLFGDHPNLTQPLMTADDPGFDASVEQTVGRLRYDSRLTDLPGALERGLYELREHGRDGPRNLVFVTDGRSDLGTPAATERRLKWMREALTELARSERVHVFIAIIGEKADFAFAQALAQATDGGYFRLTDASQLAGVLAKLQGPSLPIPRRTIPAAPTPEARPVALSPRIPSLFKWLVFGIGAVIAIIGLLTATRLRVSRRAPATCLPTQIAPELQSGHGDFTFAGTLIELRHETELMSHDVAAGVDLVRLVDVKLKALRIAIERHAFATHRKTQETEDRLVVLAREAILVGDHLEAMSKKELQSMDVATVIARAQKLVSRMLESVAIEEIPVRSGMAFDSSTQTPVSFAASHGQDGLVVEVARRGYVMRTLGADELILRPAEVIVSRHPVKTVATP